MVIEARGRRRRAQNVWRNTGVTQVIGNNGNRKATRSRVSPAGSGKGPKEWVDEVAVKVNGGVWLMIWPMMLEKLAGEVTYNPRNPPKPRDPVVSTL